MPRILVALGDGYFRFDRRERAREVWRDGLANFPSVPDFRRRVDAADEQVRGIIAGVLDADARVDTSLRELFPDLADARSAGR